MSDEKVGPIQHVLRGLLPWREPGSERTECGLLARDVRSVGTFAEMRRKVDRIGQKRAAFSSCMTCWEAVRRNRDYGHRSDVDAVFHDLLREAEWSRCRETDARVLGREIRALAILAERHAEEFASILSALDDVVSLGKVREERRKGPPHA